jgi:hypothetical protein
LKKHLKKKTATTNYKGPGKSGKAVKMGLGMPSAESHQQTAAQATARADWAERHPHLAKPSQDTLTGQ